MLSIFLLLEGLWVDRGKKKPSYIWREHEGTGQGGSCRGCKTIKTLSWSFYTGKTPGNIAGKGGKARHPKALVSPNPVL